MRLRFSARSAEALLGVSVSTTERVPETAPLAVEPSVRRGAAPPSASAPEACTSSATDTASRAAGRARFTSLIISSPSREREAFPGPRAARFPLSLRQCAGRIPGTRPRRGGNIASGAATRIRYGPFVRVPAERSGRPGSERRWRWAHVQVPVGADGRAHDQGRRTRSSRRSSVSSANARSSATRPSSRSSASRGSRTSRTTGR